MRRFFLLFIVLICSETLWAQTSKKDITLEDIWKKGTFRMRSVPGFNAMKDGKRYSQIDVENGQQSIGIYNMQTGAKEGLVFDNWKHKFFGDTLSIADYKFSEDEQTMLRPVSYTHLDVYKRQSKNRKQKSEGFTRTCW